MNPLIRPRFIRACLALRVPTAFVMMLLQRTPILRVLAAGEELVVASPVGALLRSAVAAAASLGAMHSLAGATVLVASQSGPAKATVGKSITPIAFTVSNTINIMSWRIGGALPPGLTLDAAEGGATLTGPGVLDATMGAMPTNDDPYGYGTGDSGGVATTTPILEGTPTAPGTYTFSLTAFEFGATSGLQSDSFNYTVTVDAATAATVAPTFTTQPAPQTVTAGATVTLTAAASGTPAPTYQWLKNGTAIAGATSATLTLTNVQAADAGSYSVVATNSVGNVPSSAITVAVNAPTGGAVAPAIARQPTAQTVAAGSTAVFSVDATGSPAPTFQWRKNNNPIAGATSAMLVIKGATAADAGTYTVVASNASGSPATSSAATLALSSDPNFGHLLNVSVRTTLTAAVPSFSVGTVIGGGTSGNKAILARAVGPSLAVFGVPNTISDPKFDLQSGGTSVSSNDNWGGVASISATAAAVGAFPFAALDSKDAAIATTVPGGAYTMEVSGVGGATGGVLAELYDAGGSFSAAVPRLINLSVRKQLDSGEVLTAGFVIGGNSSRTVLVRAIGPGLAVFGVAGTMPDPKLELFDGSTSLAANDNWGGDPQLNAAGGAVGAFAIADPASKDAMLLITLPPGAYSAQASGLGGSSGSVLVEVYEVP